MLRLSGQVFCRLAMSRSATQRLFAAAPLVPMRLACLALVIAAGCTSTRPDPYAGCDFSRPVSNRTVEGIQVVGSFEARDVDAISALVRSQTTEPILRITVPTETVRQFYCGELTSLPGDAAQVYTGQACDGRCGSGQVYFLSIESGTWRVKSSGVWMG